MSDDEIEKAIKPYVWGQNRGLVLERRKLILRRLDELGRGPVLVAGDRQHRCADPHDVAAKRFHR